MTKKRKRKVFFKLLLDAAGSTGQGPAQKGLLEKEMI